jgi:anti-sigma regulatory factor (Ser/Thr protein kinase)
MVTVAPCRPWAYALRLPHDPRAAHIARVTARAVLSSHGRRDVLDVVELVVSELVTNAYLYTDGPASLRLTALDDGRLRVGVWDSDPYIPPPFREPSGAPAEPIGTVDAERGRGLLLVREYADVWGGWPVGEGAFGRGGGKLLWCEVGGKLPALLK